VEEVDQSEFDQDIEIDGFQSDTLADFDGPADALVEADDRDGHVIAFAAMPAVSFA